MSGYEQYLRFERGLVVATISHYHFRRSTNQPAIPNRRACAKQEDILQMQGDNDLANDRPGEIAIRQPQAYTLSIQCGQREPSLATELES